MAEIDPRVLPDKEETKTEVKPATVAVKEAETLDAPQPLKDVVPKGEKTPESRLYAALEEERRTRKDLEQRLKEMETGLMGQVSAPSLQEVQVPEDLQVKFEKLEEELFTLKRSAEMDKVLNEFPALRGLSTELEEFRRDYPGVELTKVAKFFMVEKGLLGAERKGLEQPTGGKAVPKPTFSKEDVAKLRTEQPRKYVQMLRDGKLDPNAIK